MISAEPSGVRNPSSLVTGLVSSVVSRWGLFRHYWVVFKLCINVFATAVLLLYMDTFRLMAGMAANPSLRLAVVRNPSPVVHAVLAVALLLLATVLAVFKPPALTRYGWRRQHQAGTAHEPS